VTPVKRRWPSLPQAPLAKQGRGGRPGSLRLSLLTSTTHWEDKRIRDGKSHRSDSKQLDPAMPKGSHLPLTLHFQKLTELLKVWVWYEAPETKKG
jgi:hypothetical protein